MLGFDKSGQLNLLTASSTLGDGSLLNCLKMDNQLLATQKGFLWVKVQPGKQKAASILNKMGYATLFLETLEIIKANYTHGINFRKYRLDAHCWHFDVCVLVICTNNVKFPRYWKSRGNARSSLLWEWLTFHWLLLSEYWGALRPSLFSSSPSSLPHSDISGVPIGRGMLQVSNMSSEAILMGIFTSSLYSCFSSCRGGGLGLWAGVALQGAFHASHCWVGCDLHDDDTVLLLVPSWVSQRPQRGERKTTETFSTFSAWGFTFSLAPAQAGQAHYRPSCLEWPSPWVLVLPPPPPPSRCYPSSAYGILMFLTSNFLFISYFLTAVLSLMPPNMN